MLFAKYTRPVYAFIILLTFSTLSICSSAGEYGSAHGNRTSIPDSAQIKTSASKHTSYDRGIVRGLTLSAEDLQEDALLLRKVMLDVHPSIYRYNTVEEFEAHFQDFYAKLTRDMSEAEFMKHLAQFTEKVRCGHTYLNPWNMREDVRERLFGGSIYFPFGFVIHDDRFYVTKNASDTFDIKRGAEILRINGFETAQILDSLRSIAKTDGSNVQAKDQLLELTAFGQNDHNFFDFYFPLFFPMQDDVFEVSVRNFGANEIITHRQAALSRAEREDIIISRYGEAPSGRETWSVDVQEDIAILRLGTFATWRFDHFDAAQFYDSAFTMIRQREIENLVIDIRGNGGGLSENGALLLSYLSEDPIPCNDNAKQLIVTTRADSSYRAYVETREEIIFRGLPEAYTRPYNERYIELMEGGCEPVQPSENAFSGEVYILGNQSNVSATFSLLNIIRKEHLGTYVGEPSGGNKQGINGGSYLFLYLPNSQFEIDIPLKFSSYGAYEEDGYLSPDIAVEITQEDIALQNDPYLDKVRALISN
jgi:hypothetical protein